MKLFSYEIPDYRVFQDSFEVPYDTEEENQKFYDESYRKISLNRFYQEVFSPFPIHRSSHSK